MLSNLLQTLSGAGRPASGKENNAAHQKHKQSQKDLFKETNKIDTIQYQRAYNDQPSRTAMVGGVELRGGSQHQINHNKS